MRLAEIVRGSQTSDETIAKVVALAEGIGKRPVVVKDQPTAYGYVANRIYGALMVEADRIVHEGVATREQVDMLTMDCFRWPMGPYEMVYAPERPTGSAVREIPS